MFDYVRIKQQNGQTWIGQITQPNQNISTIGSRLDPTILHGLQLMQSHTDVQSVESVQVFDILILGQYDERQLLTPRVRPLPGAVVSRLDAKDTIKVIGIPQLINRDDGSTNVIGELLNADNVPLCIDVEKFNYHIMVAGGTGSGKSNVAANLIDQALKFRKCVLLHDAKPDYAFVDRANTDSNTNVQASWESFREYQLEPHPATDVIRVGFAGKCDPNSVQTVVGFHASDFSSEMLAGLLFTGASDQRQFEGFASAAETLREEIYNRQRTNYSLGDILTVVENRMDKKVDPREQIHEATGNAILRNARNRSRTMPWLDAIGQKTGRQPTNRLKASILDGNPGSVIQQFHLQDYVQPGGLIVISYEGMQEDPESYALILSYFLRICQQYRRKRNPVGIVQMVDEAHRIFDNESRHSATLERAFSRVMREGRSVDHSIILSLQNASQIPPRVMNNLNNKIVMRQNSKVEADAATQTMGKEFSIQAMRLGTGDALVSIYESKATVLARMAPSPYELMRNDNTGVNNHSQPQLAPVESDNDIEVDYDVQF